MDCPNCGAEGRYMAHEYQPEWADSPQRMDYTCSYCGYSNPDDSFIPDDWYEEDDRDPDTCPHCGKEYEDFSDMGCEYCDTRHPFYGIVP